jgi:hypothetical protein
MHSTLITFGHQRHMSDLLGVAGRKLLKELDTPEPWRSHVHASVRPTRVAKWDNGRVKRFLAPLIVVSAVASLAAVLAATPAAAARHPTLVLLKRAPIRVRGSGFRPRVLVKVSQGSADVHVRTSSHGGFIAALPVSDRCSAGRVLAVGPRGERAVLLIPPMLCPPARPGLGEP